MTFKYWDFHDSKWECNILEFMSHIYRLYFMLIPTHCYDLNIRHVTEMFYNFKKNILYIFIPKIPQPENVLGE